ncbi:MAG: acyltransferase [Betaproteobacteria bacterium]
MKERDTIPVIAPTAALIAGHRDNNFDILRIFAAALVIMAHSWALTGTPGEPIATLGLGVPDGGTLGVWIFFTISGYLVSRSFVQRDNLFAFIEARLLRIYPAFVACLLFGLLVGLAVTPMPWRDYWAHPQTQDYLLSNLVYDLRYRLPGVFTSNPLPNAVNGSIWSLPAETMMYVLVALMGTLTLLRRTWAAAVTLIGLLTIATLDPDAVMQIHFIDTSSLTPTISCFLLGMLLFALRERVPLHGGVVIALMAAILLLKQYQPPGRMLVCVTVAYTALWLALHRRVRLPVPDRIGDISYGLYLYAYPIQQTLVWLMPGVRPPVLFAAAFAVTSVVAWVSWHLLEKKALKLKGRISSHLNLRRQRNPQNVAAARVYKKAKSE